MRWVRLAVVVGGVLVAAILLAPLALYLHFVRLADTAIVPGAPDAFPPDALELMARSLGCDERPVFEAMNVYSVWFHQGDCELTIANQVARQMLYREGPPRPQREHLPASVATAIWVTRHWGADQALATTLEQSYFGRDAVGLDAAAQKYFARASSELTREELAQLIAAAQAPSHLDPWCGSAQNQERANRLLKRDPATPISSQIIKQPPGACTKP